MLTQRVFLFFNYPGIASILNKYKWKPCRTKDEVWVLSNTVFPLVTFDTNPIHHEGCPAVFGQLAGVYADVSPSDYRGIASHLLKFGLSFVTSAIKDKRRTIPGVQVPIYAARKVMHTRVIYHTNHKNGKLVRINPSVKYFDVSRLVATSTQESSHAQHVVLERGQQPA